MGESDRQDIERKVRCFVFADGFGQDCTPGRLSNDAPLLVGPLDWLMLGLLKLFVEVEFGVVVPEWDATPRNFGTIEDVVGYVMARRPAELHRVG